MLNASMFSSAKSDWETPKELFDKLNAEFVFDLDVCATSENAKCSAFFCPDDDGLAQDWGERVCWMNPPYGKAISQWMLKAYQASQAGATVVCLVPARTDTNWWHSFAAKGEVRFLRGRVRFVNAPSTAPFPNAVIVFRPWKVQEVE